MVDSSNSFCDYDDLPQSNWTHFSSYDSCTSDEGYYTDEKPLDEEQQQQQQQQQYQKQQQKQKQQENEIPILESTRKIRMSYSILTYTLTFTIVLLSLHTLTHQPLPWNQTFPPIFIIFHILFHLTHVTAHQLEWLGIERHCVVYGTWLYWTGRLLSRFLFSQQLAVDDNHYTTLLFWLLMLERRNAWGIIVWEYVSRLDLNTFTNEQQQGLSNQDKPLRLWELGSFRLLSFRIWCLLGTGSFWGLLYIALAKYDGLTFGFLLQFHHILKLLLVSTVGGLMMIVFWSFWTFQYRGVLWRKELRKGIIVWYSEGVARAAEVL